MTPMIMVSRATFLVFVLAFDVTLLGSDLTPFSLSSLLSLLPPSSDVTLHLVSQPSTARLSSLESPAILDYTYSPLLSAQLLATAASSVIGMYTDCPEHEVRGVLSPEESAQELADFLRAFNLTPVFLTVTATPYYQRMAHALAATALVQNVVYLKANVSVTDVDSFVGKVLKPAGSAIGVFLVNEKTGRLLTPALAAYHLLKPGYAFVYSAEAVWTTRPSGALYFTDSSAATATSRLQSEALILADLLKNVSALAHRSGGLKPRKAAFLNIVNGRLVVLETANVSGSVVFPGNSTVVPAPTKPVIDVSADFTCLNFDGTSYVSAPHLTVGISVGYAQANLRADIIPRFQFRNNSVNFGGSKFNRTWAAAQLTKSKSLIGVAFHHFSYTAPLISIFQLFNHSNVTVPVTTMATGAQLSDPQTFPLLLRTTAPSSATSVVMIRFVKLFGWKRLAVIYSDGLGNVDFYYRFANYSTTFDVSIVNSEGNRMVPQLDDGTQLNQTLYEILNSTVRVVVICHANLDIILERLYDLGARAGDYMLCNCASFQGNALTGTDEASKKRQQVAKGGLAFFERYFSGAEGPLVKRILMEREGDNFNPSACLFYDHAMLVAHAVGFMLAKGLRYEDGWSLASEMRTTRFDGCLGLIQIEPGTNDKRPGDFVIQNVHLEGENMTYSVEEAAVYSPSKTQLFKLLPALQFPDGSNTSFPDSWAQDANCPYLEKEIVDFPQGTQLSLLTNFAFTGAMCAVSGVAWLRWRSVKHSLLLVTVELSWEDSLALLSLPTEFVQLAALGPQLHFHSSQANLQALTLFNFQPFLNESQGVYLATEVAVFVLTALYVTYCVVTFASVEPCLRRWGLCFYEHWLDILISPLSNLLFVPCVFTLLSAFACSTAVGPNPTDSLLDRDCYETCWSGVHLRFAASSAVFALVYTPMAILTRPVWQELPLHLHVKTSPADFLVRSVLQLVLISSYVALRIIDEWAHALLFVLSMAGYLAFLLVTAPANYARFSLWKRLLAGAVLAYGVVGLVQVSQTDFSLSAAGFALAGVYAAIVVGGLAAQACIRRYRTFLLRSREDRYDIIKFAFTFGALAQRHLFNFKAKLAQSRYNSTSPATRPQGTYEAASGQ